MATFDSIKLAADNTAQVRKSLGAVAFLAPFETAAIDTITETTDGSLKAIPAGYKPAGIVTEDGYSFENDSSTAETPAHGYTIPVRKDLESVTRTVSFSAMEVYRREILSVAYGINLDTVTQATNGEISFTVPETPANQYYRLLLISKDGAGASEVYRAKFYPRVKLENVPSEAWGADAKSFEFTFNVEVDPTLGYVSKEFIAGPGAKTDAKLGFTKAV